MSVQPPEFGQHPQPSDFEIKRLTPEEKTRLRHEAELQAFRQEIVRLLENTLKALSAEDIVFLFFYSGEQLTEVLRLALTTALLESDKLPGNFAGFEALLPHFDDLYRIQIHPFFSKLIEEILGVHYGHLYILSSSDTRQSIDEFLGEGTEKNPWKTQLVETFRESWARKFTNAIESFQKNNPSTR